MKNRTLSVVLAALLIVGGLNVAAYAATGGDFLLGKKNAASKTTKLKNSGKGPALTLKNKPAYPPLRVSSSKKVKKLNADLVDGLDGPALRSVGYRYVLPEASGVTQATFAFPGLPSGAYFVNYSVLATLSSAGAPLNCELQGSGNRVEALSYGGSVNAFATRSASAIIDTRVSPYRLQCSTPGATLIIDPNEYAPSTVSFLRLDSAPNRASSLVQP